MTNRFIMISILFQKNASLSTLQTLQKKKQKTEMMLVMIRILLQGILVASIVVTAVPATFLLISLAMWFTVLAAYNTNKKNQEVQVSQKN